MHRDSISVGCCSSSSALRGRNKGPVAGNPAAEDEGPTAAPGGPGCTAPLADITPRAAQRSSFRLPRLPWPHFLQPLFPPLLKETTDPVSTRSIPERLPVPGSGGLHFHSRAVVPPARSQVSVWLPGCGSTTQIA